MCDVCEAEAAEAVLTVEAVKAVRIGAGEAEAGQDEVEVTRLYLAGRAEPMRAMEGQRVRVMDEAEEAEGFRTMVPSWDGCCFVCRFRRGERDHRQEIDDGLARVEEAMFRRRRFEPFSACFHCGMRSGCASGGWQRTRTAGD